MKHYLGGLLALALGLVLIVGGGLGLTSAAGGQQFPSCQPTAASGITLVTCPTAAIVVTEQTVHAAAVHSVRNAAAAPKPPATWTVTISSTNCSATTSPYHLVDETLNVPNGGSAMSDPLFAHITDGTTCDYSLSVATVTGFTSTFDPASPVQLKFDNTSASNTSVKLTNSFVAPSPSITPTTPAPVTSSSASVSASVTPSLVSETVLPPSASASSSAALANTGPKNQVSVTLVAGIALCLLGLVLLVAGRRQSRSARHGA